MKIRTPKQNFTPKGMVLALTTVALIILAILGSALLSLTGNQLQWAIGQKKQAALLLAAEAGYEKAVYWMSLQSDLLNVLKNNPEGIPNPSPVPTLNGCSVRYTVSFHDFFQSRPIYHLQAVASFGPRQHTIDGYLVQAIGGWDGTHRVPTGPSSSTPWPFATGEIIDIPLHINKWPDDPDVRDIYIAGTPHFRKKVEIGEANDNKYPPAIIALFQGGVHFNQPDSRITDRDTVQEKIDAFKETIQNQGSSDFIITPQKDPLIPGLTAPAVQLELFIDNGVGKVRITHDCTVRLYNGAGGENDTYDYKIDPAGDGSTFCRYPIYAWHYVADDNAPTVYNITDTYVAQEINGKFASPGGQIYIDGNVIIGGDTHNQMLVKGKLTIVATGNIWLADALTVDGPRDENDLPTLENPNVLGLIAQGVIKVIDPGMPEYSYVTGNGANGPVPYTGFRYAPVANHQGQELFRRILPNPLTVEAALTVGGGGWGAENVGNRKNISHNYDSLLVRGTIAEASRGIVGTASPLWHAVSNGFKKYYYLDHRLLTGILPGNFWLQRKFVLIPAGWHDYRSQSFSNPDL